MKINPSDKVLHGIPNSGIKPKGGAPATSFADLLAQTTHVASPKQVAAPPTIQPVVRPAVTTPSDEVYRSAEKMLDTMASYQHLLADSQVSLRAVEPAVRQLKKEVVSLEPLLANLDEASPVAQIAREVLISASKEIARFEEGDYVD
ncbi:MAG: hypothetical protein WAU91_03995 [Desulfatitalea sp.]